MSDDDKKPDWYEAFANAAHDLVPGWNWTVDLSPEDEAACEAIADSVAPRPEAEK